uniref:Uncharacterized protein n=1 Tax=Cuerna arida TaxID=1464854 RepID=A0A1B6EYZ0_9HEMI
MGATGISRNYNLSHRNHWQLSLLFIWCHKNHWLPLPCCSWCGNSKLCYSYGTMKTTGNSHSVVDIVPLAPTERDSPVVLIAMNMLRNSFIFNLIKFVMETIQKLVIHNFNSS